MTSDNYAREAVVVNIVDGDTFDAEVDLGYHMTTRQRFRLSGVNTPEVYGEEKEAGLKAEYFVIDKLLGRSVCLVSHKTGSFGRWLADVYYEDEDGEKNLGAELIKEGLAEPYE